MHRPVRAFGAEKTHLTLAVPVGMDLALRRPGGWLAMAALVMATAATSFADHRTSAQEAGLPIIRANVIVSGGQCIERGSQTADRVYHRVDSIIGRLCKATRLPDSRDWPFIVFRGGKLEGNAFTVSSGAMGLSEGILNATEGKDDELAGVLAHEMAHYLNGDCGVDPDICVSVDAIVRVLREQPLPSDDVGASVARERAADMLGVQIAGTAGFSRGGLLIFIGGGNGALATVNRQVRYGGQALMAAVGATYDHGLLKQRVAWLTAAVNGAATSNSQTASKWSGQIGVFRTWWGSMEKSMERNDFIASGEISIDLDASPLRNVVVDEPASVASQK
ncbi:MAG: M48 family metalloprotease [Armatimonadota bacterium]